MAKGSKTGGRTKGEPFAQILSERLGVPYEAIEVIQNDSDEMSPGASGSGGSKSLIGTGNAIGDERHSRCACGARHYRVRCPGHTAPHLAGVTEGSEYRLKKKAPKSFC